MRRNVALHNGLSEEWSFYGVDGEKLNKKALRDRGNDPAKPFPSGQETGRGVGMNRRPGGLPATILTIGASAPQRCEGVCTLQTT